jgi:NADH dehydrogenase FAD-containing subunit
LRKIVILGGGTGGLAAAKHSSEALGGDAEITLIDRGIEQILGLHISML